MKQPKLKLTELRSECGESDVFYYIKARASKIKREPDLIIAEVGGGNDIVYELFFGNDWKYRGKDWDSDAGYDHIMECPRTGLLMQSLSNEVQDEFTGVGTNYRCTNSWVYFSDRVQKAYKEYKATWELEEAIRNT